MFKRIIFFLIFAAAGYYFISHSPLFTQRQKRYRWIGNSVVSLTENTSYYRIHGSTAQALRDRMSVQGPSGYDAYTKWYISWDYDRKKQDNQCISREVKVNIKVDYTYPQWSKSEAKETGLPEKWRKYLEALRMHETGHKDIAVKAAQDIADGFTSLGEFAQCEALENTVDSKAYNIIEGARTIELNYDQQTEHGKTQGAIFP